MRGSRGVWWKGVIRDIKDITSTPSSDESDIDMDIPLSSLGKFNHNLPARETKLINYVTI